MGYVRLWIHRDVGLQKLRWDGGKWERVRLVVDMVNVDVWVTFDRRSDSLVPGRVEGGRRQVVHASGMLVGRAQKTGESRMT